MNISKVPVGYRLTQARKSLSLSIDDVVSILKIKQKAISMMEEDKYPHQAIDVFTKGQLVGYCRLLKLDPQLIINLLEAKGYDFPLNESTKIDLPKRRYPKKLLIAIVLIGLLFYFIPETSTQTHQVTQPLKRDLQYEQPL